MTVSDRKSPPSSTAQSKRYHPRMCGRYVSPEEAEIERFWKLSHSQRENPLGGRFNVSPASIVPKLLLEATGALELVGSR